jgi:hypothetical protein
VKSSPNLALFALDEPPASRDAKIWPTLLLCKGPFFTSSLLISLSNSDSMAASLPWYNMASPSSPSSNFTKGISDPISSAELWQCYAPVIYEFIPLRNSSLLHHQITYNYKGDSPTMGLTLLARFGAGHLEMTQRTSQVVGHLHAPYGMPRNVA